MEVTINHKNIRIVINPGMFDAFFFQPDENKNILFMKTVGVVQRMYSSNFIFFQALNELSENLNWPLEFVDGYIESLHVHIPWTAVLAESSLVEVNGLKVTLQPKQRQESGW